MALARIWVLCPFFSLVFFFVRLKRQIFGLNYWSCGYFVHRKWCFNFKLGDPPVFLH